MTSLRHLRSRLDTLRTELRSIVDAPAGENGDLSPQQASRFDELRAEAERLAANEGAGCCPRGL